MSHLVMLDLFSGLGGASAAMVDRGWRVISVEIEERFKPTIVADVAKLPLRPFPVDLLWASPPCTYYTRKYLETHGRLYKNEPDPDLTLFHRSQEIIAQWQPRYWAIENVQGAVRYHGHPTFRFGSRLLWTNITLMPQLPKGYAPRKHTIWGKDGLHAWRRSKIPYPLSEAIALTIESLTEAAA